ncbi:Hypothetical predicted protein [Podarcis lilfordi]|uniref:Uncharacterized protein n=1 Tax=Podarcis lilfordi TaxID=74358 RepID=A0AA35JZM5_9SAUR|nr:Hypothetical predicted protein [Podarcis lilfordi]
MKIETEQFFDINTDTLTARIYEWCSKVAPSRSLLPHLSLLSGQIRFLEQGWQAKLRYTEAGQNHTGRAATTPSVPGNPESQPREKAVPCYYWLSPLHKLNPQTCRQKFYGRA